jgi:hypothetical protein
MKILRISSAFGLSIGLVLFGVSPAALADNSISDLEQLLVDSAPAIIDETNASIAPEVEVTDSGITITPELDAIDVPRNAELIAPPKLTVDFASKVEHESADGIVELATNDGGSSAFMQPTETGFRLVTSTASKDGPDSFDYTLEIPSDSRLVDRGELIFIKAGEEILGILEQPWAKDSNAVDVPTWYTLSAGVLTQHLDLSAVDAYPVVADPAWSYSLTYDTNKSTVAVTNLIGSCFSCYFPLEGAPRAWPRIGQYLPLKVLGVPFPVTMATVSSNPSYTWFQFSFYATANHPDGPGSAISFTFENQKMVVYAWITRDLGPVLNGANQAGASVSWALFARNLRNA